MISVTRSDLVSSESAIRTLGKTFMPVEKERYWFIKTLSKLQKAITQQNQLINSKRNALIKELGKLQENGKIGLMPDDPEMEIFTSTMEEFVLEEVELDVNQITLSTLEKAQVTMVAEEQVNILWLIDSEEH